MRGDVLLGDPVPHLTDSQVRTLEGEEGLENLDRGRGSILTRRLGLIIGSCMGFVVFIVLVSILGYLKLKKQREVAKREQPGPAEYLSYRHFSLQTADPLGQGHGTSILNS
ncbi:hypothetical protein J6590_086115 [Homalodisca vitripennis]|nr:hypothetical protein J6590_087911 [Homalodisca vitripennis]KAG8295796.1 hypothetical protein J6590_072798 [Homalodisca vitripennis]KAG8304785.1 hypothetical protein J6590_086115 [Homalodisca vitripennis]